MPRPKPAEEPVQIAVRIAPSLLKRLDAEAEASERSRNAVIAEALAAHIDESGSRRATQKLAKGLAAQKARVEAAKPAATPGRMTFDDVRPKFVPRLKPDKVKR
jgi:predicted transcriptional regulator